MLSASIAGTLHSIHNAFTELWVENKTFQDVCTVAAECRVAIVNPLRPGFRVKLGE